MAVGSRTNAARGKNRAWPVRISFGAAVGAVLHGLSLNNCSQEIVGVSSTIWARGRGHSTLLTRSQSNEDAERGKQQISDNPFFLPPLQFSTQPLRPRGTEALARPTSRSSESNQSALNGEPIFYSTSPESPPIRAPPSRSEKRMSTGHIRNSGNGKLQRRLSSG